MIVNKSLMQFLFIYMVFYIIYYIIRCQVYVNVRKHKKHKEGRWSVHCMYARLFLYHTIYPM